jgi:hypothetical protein
MGIGGYLQVGRRWATDGWLVSAGEPAVKGWMGVGEPARRKIVMRAPAWDA